MQVGRGEKIMNDAVHPISSYEGESMYTPDDLSDINLLAVKEFIRILQSDQSIAPEWKEEMLQMLENGVPEDISPLCRMIEECIHASTQKINSEELPRNY